MAALDVGGGAGDLLLPGPPTPGPPAAADEDGADDVGGVADRLAAAAGPDPGDPWNGAAPPGPPGEAP